MVGVLLLLLEVVVVVVMVIVVVMFIFIICQSDPKPLSAYYYHELLRCKAAFHTGWHQCIPDTL
jgi:hypothetical protein